MKIRTITAGVELKNLDLDKINRAGNFLQLAKNIYQESGIEVQDLRIATNSWVEYSSTSKEEDIIQMIRIMEKVCLDQKVSFLSIGYVENPIKARLIPQIIKATERVSCSVKIGDIQKGINFESAKISAWLIKKLSIETSNGLGNFSFCAWSNCPPNIPFFPAAYHQGEDAFSIGLESSDLVGRVFREAKSFLEARENFEKICNDEMSKIVEIAEELSCQIGLKFKGLDVSIAPSLEKEESLAFAFEANGLNPVRVKRFGDVGTLAIASMISDVLKNLSFKKCGYCGLMFPILEDYGLVMRINEGTYHINELLLLSCVCGCGLDTIPLPGEVEEETIFHLLLDVASLSIKLNKPLSARLLPVPGKKAGDMTDFKSPYLIDCKIPSLR